MTKASRTTKSTRKQYTRLEPRVKSLNEGTIRKRWKKLPINTQTRVANLLKTLQRPALSQGGNDKKNTEVQAFVSEMVEDLIQRLPRMPFPPGTDELSFDFESTINHQRTLENQLTTYGHTIALLRAEIEADTSLLEQEKKELEAIEKDIAEIDQTDENRLHPFARESSLGDSRPLTADYEARSATKIATPTLADLEHDTEAKDILDQLRHHLDSMEKNVEGAKDIATALSTAQAALDVFNWKQLRKAEYCQIYGVDAT